MLQVFKTVNLPEVQNVHQVRYEQHRDLLSRCL